MERDLPPHSSLPMSAQKQGLGQDGEDMSQELHPGLPGTH